MSRSEREMWLEAIAAESSLIPLDLEDESGHLDTAQMLWRAFCRRLEADPPMTPELLAKRMSEYEERCGFTVPWLGISFRTDRELWEWLEQHS